MTSMETTEDDLGISARVQDFQKDLGSLSDGVVGQKHITSGESHILDGYQYFALKHEVSENFRVHPSQVICNFIATVLDSYPFPEIYVATGDVDLDKGRGQKCWLTGSSE